MSKHTDGDQTSATLQAIAPLKAKAEGPDQTPQTNYFRSYRNDVLCKFMIPPYEWGMTHTPYTSNPEIASNYDRRNLTQMLVTPKISPRLINKGRAYEVDTFYVLVQMERDRYRDSSGKSSKLKFFEDGKMLFAQPDSLPSIYTSSPYSYYTRKQPLVLPVALGRTRPVPIAKQRYLGRNFSPYEDFRWL